MLPSYSVVGSLRRSGWGAYSGNDRCEEIAGVFSWHKMRYENYYNCLTDRSPKNETERWRKSRSVSLCLVGIATHRGLEYRR